MAVALELLAGVGAGLLLAIQFNPLASVVGAALTAALAAVGRTRLAVAALVLAWLVGDGARVIMRLSELASGAHLLAGGAPSQWAALAAWALGGLAFGYALPAWTGAFVGSRVTHGTGWLAAGALAATAAMALATLPRVLG